MKMDLTVLSLLEYLETEIRNASSFPLSSKKLVDAAKCLDLLDELRLRIPEEFKRAQRIVTDQDSIRHQAEENAQQQMDYAEARAQQIIAEARKEAEELVQESRIVVEAEERARDIVDKATAEADQMKQDAERTADEMRADTLDYADRILARVETRLDEALNQVVRTRQELEEAR